MVQSLWKTVRKFLKKLSIQLPKVQPISFLDMYLKNVSRYSNENLYMKIYGSTIHNNKRRKHPQTPSTDG